ncbi:MAG: pentapeptide repeat-containing protein, partial [Candidatus Nanopelagicales bacterium]
MAREARPLPPTTEEVDGEDWYARAITGESFEGVLFREVDLTEAVTSGATFSGCVFRDVRFNASRHSASAFLGCAFVQSSFFDARFEGCKLTGSWFDRCTFTSFAVDGGDWSFVGLAGADLGKASISGVRLREADLTGAKAVGATLRDCDLTGAWLHNADLSRGPARLGPRHARPRRRHACRRAGAVAAGGADRDVARARRRGRVRGSGVSQWTGTFESGAIGVPMTVGPVKALTRALRGAFQLKGRSSRSEYWWFQLWLAVWLLAMLAVDGWNDLGGWVFLLAVLVVLPASVWRCVRRLLVGGCAGAG